ncbi:hypothetical protein ONV78_26615 [Hahella sp. CR1]|uniref:hypothetical protein n=1 Tax=Hahella sp. CR1 TaxID=2992807 RepID=UPI0024433755|nr:hypothetical protein [Hahella sp. CR1]MDG9671335.1 hypothetical protein [Hahella sp. CR1]
MNKDLSVGALMGLASGLLIAGIGVLLELADWSDALWVNYWMPGGVLGAAICFGAWRRGWNAERKGLRLLIVIAATILGWRLCFLFFISSWEVVSLALMGAVGACVTAVGVILAWRIRAWWIFLASFTLAGAAGGVVDFVLINSLPEVAKVAVWHGFWESAAIFPVWQAITLACALAVGGPNSPDRAFPTPKTGKRR